MAETEELLQELIVEVKGLRADLRQAETRVAMINLAEGELDKGLGRHIHFIRCLIKKFYDDAIKNDEQYIIDAISNCPYPIITNE